MRGVTVTILVMACVLSGSPASSVTVEADTAISWKIVEGVLNDAASVRTFHFNTLTQANGLELNAYKLVIDATMFRNSVAIQDIRVWDDTILLNSPGTLITSLVTGGPCLTIEGLYQGRTIAGAGPKPFILSGSSKVHTTGPLGLNCPPPDDGDGPNPCGAVAENTQTTAVSLDATTLGGVDATTPSLQYPLARSERRGDDVFVMDEWAVISGGDVVAASAPEFGEAVVAQQETTPGEAFLVVEEPIHVRNERHVHKPRLRLARAGLPPALRGDGQLVVVRLEFPEEEGPPDRVEILFSSAPVDAALLEDVLRTRSGLLFASERRHRAGAYVVFRLGNRLEVLQSFTVLPQCCCGEIFCI